MYRGGSSNSILYCHLLEYFCTVGLMQFIAAAMTEQLANSHLLRLCAEKLVVCSAP